MLYEVITEFPAFADDDALCKSADRLSDRSAAAIHEPGDDDRNGEAQNASPDSGGG